MSSKTQSTAVSAESAIFDDKINYRVRNNRGGDVVARESEIDLQALSYLMTIVIHRLHETDPAGWQELLKEIQAEKKAVVRDAPGIVEHSLVQDSPSAKPQKSVARKDGK